MVPMLVLPQIILIDTMGFGILTPLLASALAPESDFAICRRFSQDHRYLIYVFESVPLIASSLLMAVSWIIFQTQRPKTAIEELEPQLRVAKGLSH